MAKGARVAEWVIESIERWTCDGTLRRESSSMMPPVTRLLTQQTEATATSAMPVLDLELQLIAKSDPGDIATLSYTDAFTVYQYRVLNVDRVRYPLSEMGVDVQVDPLPTYVYVLHWAVHNDGTGIRGPAVTTRATGEIVSMRLSPVHGHPLGKPLATMPQFNEFDDLLAPIFLASNFLEERSR